MKIPNLIPAGSRKRNPMSMKLEEVPVPESLRQAHERQGGAELEMYSVARVKGFLRLTVAEEVVRKTGSRVTHLSVSFAQSGDPDSPPTRRPNDKEMREIQTHFAFIGTFEEDNSMSDAGSLVRHLWHAGK